MATPSQRPPRTESDYVLSYKKIDSVTTVVREAVKWAAIVLIVRYGYYAIAVLAGRSTFADIVVRFLANLKVSDGILYLLTGGSICYGVGQRYLRRRHIKRVVPAKNRLERMLDPNRGFVNRDWPTFDHPIWSTPLVNQLRAPGRSVVLRRP